MQGLKPAFCASQQCKPIHQTPYGFRALPQRSEAPPARRKLMQLFHKAQIGGLDFRRGFRPHFAVGAAWAAPEETPLTAAELNSQHTGTEPDTAPWWRGASIYQVYPRSYADSNGDGVGDLPGLTARLDHIASLGVDAVWVSPFYRSPMIDYGYDVADYCDVDPIFGTLADFDALIEKAHGLGLKVIVDQVYSHTSDLHAWFQESRTSRTNAKADWYVWADPKADGAPPNNWQSVFGGPAWTWDARRGQYYMHNFLREQPQLNLHNPDVQQAILDVTAFWLERGVDGFRLDAVSFMMHDPALKDNPARDPDPAWKRTRPYDFQRHLYNQSQPEIVGFLKRMRALADRYGEKYMVAEIDREHASHEMKAFTQGDALLQSAYGFTYLYADRLEPALVRRACAEWPGEPGEGWPSWTFSNHDAPRAVTRWAEDRDPKAFAEMAILLLACLRGNIFLYQGEELGLPQADVAFEHLKDPEAIANWPLTLGRDGARTPLPWEDAAAFCAFSEAEPWLPHDARHRALAVSAQERDPHSTLNWTRRVLRLRRNLEALREGAMRFHETSGDVLAFERGDGAEAVLCVFNLGHEAADYQLPEGWRTIERVNRSRNGGVLAPLEGLIAERA